MGDIGIRRGGIADAPALKSLWSRVFGDTDADIDEFFETFFDVSVCVVAEVQDTLAAMGFLLPAGIFRSPDKNEVSCGMIYAVATEPSQRGKSCGSAVTRGLMDDASEHGIDAVVLHPAEDSLFEFYSDRVGLETVFYCTQERLDISPRDDILLHRVSAAEYIAVREKILKDTPHITFDERCFAYQQRLCGDGGLFVVEFEDGKKCCAVVEAVTSNTVEASYDTVRIIELLGDGETLLSTTASAIANEFPAKEYLVRRIGSEVRFGMLNAKLSDQNTWFGLAFD